MVALKDKEKAELLDQQSKGKQESLASKDMELERYAKRMWTECGSCFSLLLFISFVSQIPYHSFPWFFKPLAIHFLGFWNLLPFTFCFFNSLAVFSWILNTLPYISLVFHIPYHTFPWFLNPLQLMPWFFLYFLTTHLLIFLTLTISFPWGFKFLTIHFLMGFDLALESRLI